MPRAIPAPAYAARIDGFSPPLAKPNPSDAFVFGGNLLVGVVRQQCGRDDADMGKPTQPGQAAFGSIQEIVKIL
jgi:hypothetical protein